MNPRRPTTPAFASGRTTGAPAQRLTLWFTSREVVILRSGLERIEDRLAEDHLRGVKTVEPRYASLLKVGPVVLSITVQRKEEL